MRPVLHGEVVSHIDESPVVELSIYPVTKRNSTTRNIRNSHMSASTPNENARLSGVFASNQPRSTFVKSGIVIHWPIATLSVLLMSIDAAIPEGKEVWPDRHIEQHDDGIKAKQHGHRDFPVGGGLPSGPVASPANQIPKPDGNVLSSNVTDFVTELLDPFGAYRRIEPALQRWLVVEVNDRDPLARLSFGGRIKLGRLIARKTLRGLESARAGIPGNAARGLRPRAGRRPSRPAYDGNRWEAADRSRVQSSCVSPDLRLSQKQLPSTDDKRSRSGTTAVPRQSVGTRFFWLGLKSGS